MWSVSQIMEEHYIERMVNHELGYNYNIRYHIISRGRHNAHTDKKKKR